MSSATPEGALAVRRLDCDDADFDARLAGAADSARDAEIENSVAEIIAQVRARGDRALLEYTQRFDGRAAAKVADLRVAPAQIRAGAARAAPEFRAALAEAAARIRACAERQRLQDWSLWDADGTQVGQRVTPLDAVGLYVPGGKSAYPSSVLMNAIPAAVAGVARVVMATPAPHGEIAPEVLAAAELCGVEEVWTIGGAQAIAALAYGVESLPPVDKIVGPGNAYVAEAKRQVFGRVGIDSIAGPSEILVIADGAAPARWTAADLFSQAEHDEDARAMLLCPDAAHIDAVAAEMDEMIARAPRADIIRESLRRNGLLARVRDLEHAVALANRVAPEHLELAVADPDALLPLVRNAGAVFVGPHASETLGDYCAGPNHVLPTGGTARFASPLGVYDFQKRTGVVRCAAAGADKLGRVATRLAEAEGLFAHADAARCRLSQ